MESYTGIINEKESYTYSDGEWKDYTVSGGINDEIKRRTGHEPGEKVSFDNFPIKCYTQTLDNDTEFQLLTENVVYYKTKEHNSKIMRFGIHANDVYEPEITADDVRWGILPYEEDGEVYIDGETVSGDPTSFKFISKDTQDKRTRIYVTIKGIGFNRHFFNLSIK